MLSSTECQSTILDIFIKSMGKGFIKLLFLDSTKERGENTNNFKQKISKMRKGDEEAIYYVYKKIDEAISIFSSYDEQEIFCESKGSDKYYTFAFDIWSAFSGKIKALLNLKEYENLEGMKEEVIASILSNSLVSTISKIASEDYLKTHLQSEQNSIIYLEEINEKIRKENEKHKKLVESAFRKEYYTSFRDVLRNKKRNKTFYKWVLDEFKKETKPEFDPIISLTLGKGESNIEKMKYEIGLRKWTTFEKLFENEQKNKELKNELEKNNLMAEYQIFQSRMLAAYFLENLRAILPDYINKDNTKKMFEDIYSSIKE